MNVTTWEDSGKSATDMVYGTTLSLPSQLAVADKMPVEEILWDPRTVDPSPTRHARAEAPTEPPAHLAAAELVYICKGSNLSHLVPP